MYEVLMHEKEKGGVKKKIILSKDTIDIDNDLMLSF
jgi:hypothetical protein